MTVAVISNFKSEYLKVIFPDLRENVPVYRFAPAGNDFRKGLLPFRWEAFQYLARNYTKIYIAGPVTANDQLFQGEKYLLNEVACLFLKGAASDCGNELLIQEDDVPSPEPTDLQVNTAKHTVTSVQKFRMNEESPLKNRKPAALYFDWVNKSFRGVVKIKSKNHQHVFLAKGCPLPLLVLEENLSVSHPGIQEFIIQGGILNKERSAAAADGRFIFFLKKNGTPHLYTALFHFKPALPWHVYKVTQGRFHQIVMQQFGKSL